MERGMEDEDEFEMSSGRLCEKLRTNQKSGLGDEEARARLAEGGPNCVEYVRGQRLAGLLLKAVFGGYKFFLWSNLAVCALLYALELARGRPDHRDIGRMAAVLLLVVLLAAIASACTRRPHAFLLERLARLVHRPVKVIRAGLASRVGVEQLVRGDLVRVAPGDLIPADLRLVETSGVRLNNLFLSHGMQAAKSGPAHAAVTRLLANPHVALFGGLVTEGSARGLVVATGSRTAMSRLVSSWRHGNRNTRLVTKEIDQIKRVIRVSSAAMAAIAYLVFLAAGKSGLDTAMFLCGYNIASTCLYLQLDHYRHSGSPTRHGD